MPDWIDAVKLTWLAVGMLLGANLALLSVLILRDRKRG